VRTWWAMFAAGFHRYSGYRAATAAGAFTNTVFGVLKASVYLGAISSAGGAIAGYDAQTSVTYAWLTQALIAPINVFARTELAQRVRTGDIAIDLARPADLQLSWLASDLGRAAYVILPRGLPPLLAGWLITGLSLPSQPLPYLLGSISVVLAVAVSAATQFLVSLTAFWLIEVRGLITLYTAFSGLLCGHLVPVAWFPDWLRLIAALTPFPSMLQVPIDVLLGRLQGPDALGALGVQMLWLGTMLVAGRLVLFRGTSRLVVQGG